MKRVYLIAIAVALLAGCATFLFASNLEQKSSIENAPTQQVMVATQDIKAGAEIKAEDVDTYFTTKAVLKQDLTPNAIINKADLVGLITTRAIYAGEQVSKNAFLAEGQDGAGLSYQLKEGEVAYSIKAEEVIGVDGYVRPGDTVDIIVNNGDDDGSQIEFKGLEVLKIATYQEDEAAKNDGSNDVKTYVSVTLRTTPVDAVKIHTMESKANVKYKMILNARAALDEE